MSKLTALAAEFAQKRIQHAVDKVATGEEGWKGKYVRSLMGIGNFLTGNGNGNGNRPINNKRGRWPENMVNGTPSVKQTEEALGPDNVEMAKAAEKDALEGHAGENQAMKLNYDPIVAIDRGFIESVRGFGGAQNSSKGYFSQELMAAYLAAHKLSGSTTRSSPHKDYNRSYREMGMAR